LLSILSLVYVCLDFLPLRCSFRHVTNAICQLLILLPVMIFFFQAEDGIRDRNVTGVQTCALPIFGSIEGNDSPTTGDMGLRDHLDEAVDQADGQPLVFQLVIYNLPGRDCAALASNGELGPEE